MPARRPAGRSRASTPRASTPHASTPHASTSRASTSRAAANNHHGIHLLRSSGTVRALVESADLVPDALVLDLGAGPGTLTAPLASTGARVIAIEQDPTFLLRLRKRFDDLPNVRVVAGDLAVVPLPRRSFQVVASVPYALSTTLLRRLLPGRTGLSAALAEVVGKAGAHRIAASIDLDQATVAGDVAAGRWGEVARLAAAGPAVAAPRLPKIPARLLDPGPGPRRR